jgi:hypothetical protein
MWGDRAMTTTINTARLVAPGYRMNGNLTRAILDDDYYDTIIRRGEIAAAILRPDILEGLSKRYCNRWEFVANEYGDAWLEFACEDDASDWEVIWGHG